MWLESHVIPVNAVGKCEQSAYLRKAEWAVYYKAVILIHMYLTT